MENNEENRRIWANRLINSARALNMWCYPPSFEYVGDEMVMECGVIAGKLDKYLLNADIAGLLGKYIFANVMDVVGSEETIAEIFENTANRESCREFFGLFWNFWQ